MYLVIFLSYSIENYNSELISSGPLHTQLEIWELYTCQINPTIIYISYKNYQRITWANGKNL